MRPRAPPRAHTRVHTHIHAHRCSQGRRAATCSHTKRCKRPPIRALSALLRYNHSRAGRKEEEEEEEEEEERLFKADAVNEGGHRRGGFNLVYLFSSLLSEFSE